MRVNSERVPQSGLDRPDDAFQVMGQRPTVGVAQDHGLRAAANRGLQCFESIGGVGLVAIEEVFRIVDHALAVIPEIRDGMLDDAQIIVGRGEQDVRDVQRPRLAENGADRCPRIEQGLDVDIIFGAGFNPACSSECGNERRLPLQVTGALEELNIFRIGAGPTTFDEADPKIIEFAGPRVSCRWRTA